MDKDKPHCIVYGAFDYGFTIVGPFATYADARKYAGDLSERISIDETWTEDIMIVPVKMRHPKDDQS